MGKMLVRSMSDQSLWSDLPSDLGDSYEHDNMFMDNEIRKQFNQTINCEY